MFRHRRLPNYKFPAPSEPSVRVKETSYDEYGNTCFSVVSKPLSEVNASIPNPSDYTLDKLLNANIPLQKVDCSLDNELNTNNIETYVEHNFKIEDNEN